MVVAVLVLVSSVGCGSDSTSSHTADHVPDFVYVSNQNGNDQLFVYSSGTSTLLSNSMQGDADPQSAHGRIVFTGYRDSPTNAEIYSTKLDGSDLQRLTNNGALDFQPSPSPDGTKIVFVSLRSGTSRLWIMGADGSDPAALPTGSDDFTPESAPRFSPEGTRILFNSPRTGTSQLYVVSAAGGDAAQLTHELNGAFDGSWDSDGESAEYIDGQNRAVIHRIDVGTGAVTQPITGGSDIGEPTCDDDFCLVVSGRTSGSGDINAYDKAGQHDPVKVVESPANERQPAFLVP